VVLLSFGGIGLPGFAPEVLAPLTDFQFLLPAATGLPAHATSVTADRLRAAGLRYEDVVGAVDVVVTKPGYGIVTDALGARTRLVYTERGDFPEYEILVRELPALLPCAYVSNEDLRAGRLEKPIRSVLAQPFPEPPDLSGAEKAADRLLDSFWE
jgi:L-arabinokinase